MRDNCDSFCWKTVQGFLYVSSIMQNPINTSPTSAMRSEALNVSEMCPLKFEHHQL
jgi:hypothetical protein